MRSSDVQYTNRGSAIGQVGLKPRKSGVRYPKLLFSWAGEEDLVVYGVKHCTEVERNDGGGFARVREEENTV